MPTYDLRCDDCGTRFERFLTRMLREEDKVCPSCGSGKVRTLISGGFLKSAGQGGGSASCGGSGRFA